MKKEISTPAMIGIVVVVVLLLGGAIYKFTGAGGKSAEAEKTEQQGAQMMRNLPRPGRTK